MDSQLGGAPLFDQNERILVGGEFFKGQIGCHEEEKTKGAYVDIPFVLNGMLIYYH